MRKVVRTKRTATALAQTLTLELHVQIGCKLGIGNRKDELTKQARRNKLRIKPKVIKGINACRKRKRSSETLPAEGIGYIPVTRGHREGFGDCAMCH